MLAALLWLQRKIEVSVNMVPFWYLAKQHFSSYLAHFAVLAMLNLFLERSDLDRLISPLPSPGSALPQFAAPTAP